MQVGKLYRLRLPTFLGRSEDDRESMILNEGDLVLLVDTNEEEFTVRFLFKDRVWRKDFYDFKSSGWTLATYWDDFFDEAKK